MNRRPAHPHWCAQGHRCGLGEHCADPLTVTVPGVGTAVLTRVRATDGRDHAEIRIRVALANHEPTARRQLQRVLADLHTLIRRATTLTRRAA